MLEAFLKKCKIENFKKIDQNKLISIEKLNNIEKLNVLQKELDEHQNDLIKLSSQFLAAFSEVVNDKVKEIEKNWWDICRLMMQLFHKKLKKLQVQF